MNQKLKSWMDSLIMPSRPDEYESKKLLKIFDIAVPAGIRLQPEDGLRKINQEELTFLPPFIAKVCSADILHKTDQHGVLFNLDMQSLSDAVKDLRKRFPQAGILVEEQLSFEGSEFILGALIDPTLGPAVMFGAGGILTELYRDVSFRLAPCTKQESLRMLKELTISPVLEGYRGLQTDVSTLAEIISIVGNIAMDLGSIFSQLDVNPLVLAEGRWIALDAKLLLNI